MSTAAPESNFRKCSLAHHVHVIFTLFWWQKNRLMNMHLSTKNYHGRTTRRGYSRISRRILEPIHISVIRPRIFIRLSTYVPPMITSLWKKIWKVIMSRRALVSNFRKNSLAHHVFILSSWFRCQLDRLINLHLPSKNKSARTTRRRYSSIFPQSSGYFKLFQTRHDSLTKCLLPLNTNS